LIFKYQPRVEKSPRFDFFSRRVKVTGYIA